MKRLFIVPLLLCLSAGAIEVTNFYTLQSISTGTRISNVPGPGGGDALTNNAVAHWSMDEASGSRTDIVSALNLTDVGSDTASASGIITNAAGPFTDAGLLRHLDDAKLSLSGGTNEPFTILCWVKTATNQSSGIVPIIEKGIIGGETEYAIGYNAESPTFYGIIGNEGGSIFVQSTNLNPLSNATWYHLALRHDTNSSELILNVDATNQYSIPAIIGTFDGTNSFKVGNDENSALPWTNLIDEVTLLKRTMTSNEVWQVYSKELNGNPYPWTGTNVAGAGNGLLTGLIAVWDMEVPDATDVTNSLGASNVLTRIGATVQQTTHIQGSFADSGTTSAYWTNAESVFEGTGSFSLALWINRHNVNVDGDIIAGRWGSGHSWLLWFVGNVPRFSIRNSADASNFNADSTVTLDANGWHLVVITYNSSTAIGQISVDNETFVATATTDGMRSTSEPFQFGAGVSYHDAAAYWDNTVLSQTKVGTLYNSGSGFFHSGGGWTGP